ncbi:hypothetical protein FLAG1_07424 [Fusarium langsethiae]|uniref:Uncharacterized protein n=1 Tax=Fusarium langsethiae TaxID=179993 RepID=A0A0M9EU51_FUSLA|nr:hypothetical protein FLAG1_07424 [Fusarium langsethiae]
MLTNRAAVALDYNLLHLFIFPLLLLKHAPSSPSYINTTHHQHRNSTSKIFRFNESFLSSSHIPPILSYLRSFSIF